VLFFPSCCARPALLSFPTRRSSDLGRLPEAGTDGIAIADGFAELRGIAVGDVVPFVFSGGRVELTVTGLLDDGVGAASTNGGRVDRKSTRLNSSHVKISYAVFCSHN